MVQTYSEPSPFLYIYLITFASAISFTNIVIESMLQNSNDLVPLYGTIISSK